MEYEYLQGILISSPGNPVYFLVGLNGPKQEHHSHVSLDSIGSNGWELVGMATLDNQIHVIFKRQAYVAIDDRG